MILVQSNQAKSAYKSLKASSQIVRNVFEVNVLTDDFLAHPYEERPLVQWRVKHSDLTNLLKEAKPNSNETEILLQRLLKSNGTVTALFDRLTAATDQAPHEDPAFTKERRWRLSAMISHQLQTMVKDASELYEFNQSKLEANQNRTGHAILLFIAFMLALKSLNLLTLHSAVFKPLKKLTQGVKMIAAGNLDHGVAVSGNDEIGALGNSFNRMTTNLKASYGKLQDEIHEREEAQRILNLKSEELARSNSELEHFAYVASHDLQEPLRNTTSCIKLLEKKYKGQLDANADTLINYAVESVYRMQGLIQDLLAYSRIGSKPPKLTTLNGSELVERAMDNLSVTLKETGAEVRYGDLPDVTCDPGQMTMVFQNLIGNAVKFRGSEPPRVTIEAAQSNGRVVFSVEDNGIGIEPEYLDKIFVIFERLHSRAEYPGTGIGLAVTKKIIERHGGTISVQSEPGRGSVFTFTLS